MGYRGKVSEQARARELRVTGHTLLQIADELGVSKSSVSRWVRDVPFTPSRRRRGPQHRPNRLRDRRLAEIADLDAAGIARIGVLSEDAFLAAGVALYAGEGAKRDGVVQFTNSDPGMMGFFCAWLRTHFDIDESKLRVSLYLHQGLDLEAAQTFWAAVTAIPIAQFLKAYRAVPDAGIRLTKHVHGCASVRYYSARTHRAIMGMVRALLCGRAIPG
jgi:transcriptional regulator with XRE-family HTH domain